MIVDFVGWYCDSCTFSVIFLFIVQLLCWSFDFLAAWLWLLLAVTVCFENKYDDDDDDDDNDVIKIIIQHLCSTEFEIF